MDTESTEITQPSSSKEKVIQSLPDAQKYIAFRMAELSPNTAKGGRYREQLELLNNRLKNDENFRDKVIQEITNVVQNTDRITLANGREVSGLSAKVIRALSLSGENIPLTSYEVGNIIYGDTSDRQRTQQRVGGVFKHLRNTLKDSELKLYTEDGVDGKSPGYYIDKRVLFFDESDDLNGQNIDAKSADQFLDEIRYWTRKNKILRADFPEDPTAEKLRTGKREISSTRDESRISEQTDDTYRVRDGEKTLTGRPDAGTTYRQIGGEMTIIRPNKHKQQEVTSGPRVVPNESRIENFINQLRTYRDRFLVRLKSEVDFLRREIQEFLN